MKLQLTILLAILGLAYSQASQKSVKLSVYYESRCPDSHNFILNQLAPAWPRFHRHIDLELVPFGNEVVTAQNGRNVYKCQHGPEECWGNRVEACVIHQG